MDEIETRTPDQKPESPTPKGRNIGRTVLLIVVVLLVLAAIGAAIYGMVVNPGFTAVLRDIFIIVLALVTIIIGLFLAILIFQLQSLMALLRDEIKPILQSANQTVSTVRGTTTFVSDNVVSPMIQVLSFAAGVQQTAKVLIRGPNGNRRRDGKAGR